MQIDRTLTFLSYRFWPKMMSCVGLVAIADFLFYGHGAGATLGLFAMLLLSVLVLHNPRVTSSRTGKMLYASAAGLALALVNEPGWLPAVSFVVVAIVLANLTKHPLRDARDLPREIAWALVGRAGFFSDALTVFRARKRRPSGFEPGRVMRRWLLPLILSAVFVWLFSQANPLIDNVLGHVD